MALFRSRGISLRLASAFALVLAMMVALAALSSVQLLRLQRHADELVARHVTVLGVLGQMQENAGERSVLLRDLVLDETVAGQDAVKQKLAANSNVLAEVKGRFSELADSGQSGSVGESLHRIVELLERTGAIEKQVLDHVAAARFEAAKQVLADQLTAQHESLNRYLRQAFSASMSQANRSVAESRKQDQWALLVIAALGGAAVLVGATVAFFTARAIVRPVRRATDATLQIAGGDLTQPLSTRSRDEVGQLVSALEWMRQALSGSVADIRRAAERVRGGAERIEQGSGDLAARTEEQAASLEESASSMEEFTATVQQNAQSAGQASALAVQTSEVAVRGGEAVRGVVATMQGIHSASARIGDIIGVIDSIAFQTNILALNAAVEAARAGEQGRGFAVVAGEVRALAQRSAEAAREIKTLIQDATGRVDGGVRQVQDAGRTMDEIVGSVEKMKQLVAEIAHASAEQLSGIEQVNRAIAQMDGNTQRNASLVQQAAEAAQEMAGEAQVLVEAVAKFRLPEQAAPAPEVVAAAPRAARRRPAPVREMEPEPEMLSLPAPLA
ncbi:MAG TPA: methyl-accepting chemotaxis protein [Ramlibacter sp.]|jgi:methyl-accepting chemotaxis protein|nr:methyl-accepting chemotaxis protein [Ramlibacter sp.]